MQMFLTAFVSCSLRLFKLERDGQYTENLIAKLQNSNQNTCLSWLAQLGFEQPGPGAPLLDLAKSI